MERDQKYWDHVKNLQGVGVGLFALFVWFILAIVSFGALSETAKKEPMIVQLVMSAIGAFFMTIILCIFVGFVVGVGMILFDLLRDVYSWCKEDFILYKHSLLYIVYFEIQRHLLYHQFPTTPPSSENPTADPLVSSSICTITAMDKNSK